MVLQVQRLTNEQVKTWDMDNLLFVYVSESGAMGNPGELLFLYNKGEEIAWITTNVREKEFISLKRKLPSFHKLDLNAPPKGWRHEYLGFGHHLYIRNEIWGLYLEMHGEKEETSKEDVERTAIEYWEKERRKQGLSYNVQWSRKTLTPQKLGTFCEYYAKMILASYGASVYTSEVDDHGIDFVLETPKGRFKKIQVKSVRLETTKYVYMEARKFPIDDPDLYLFLLILKDGKHPEAYLIPAAEWKSGQGEGMFVHHGQYKVPEYGLNLSDKHLEALQIYRVKEQIEKIFGREENRKYDQRT